MKYAVMGLALAFVATNAMAKEKGDAKETAQKVMDQVADAFNKGDPKAFMALWGDDGKLINPAGMVGEGKAGVEKVVTQDLNTILKGSTSKFTVESVRQITPNNLWVDCTHHIAGGHTPDGKTADLNLHAVILMTKKKDKWVAVEARPYAFLPPPPPAGAMPPGAPTMPAPTPAK
jgi:uncharacterized protein (TIGR02246 family)